MRRCEFIGLLGVAAAAWPRPMSLRERTRPGLVSAIPCEGPALVTGRAGYVVLQIRRR